MTRARKVWLVVMAAELIALAWILWPVLKKTSPDTADVQVRARPSQSVGPSPALPPPVSPTAATDRAVAAAETRNDAGVVSPAPRPRSPAADAELQLAFVLPQSVQVGEAFDVRVSVMARQPVGNIAVEVTYDPALLKARGLEEIDYAQRSPGERMFRITGNSDGRIELSIAADRAHPEQAMPAGLPLVQFEALAPGRAHVRVDSIEVSNPRGVAMSWSAIGRDSEVVLD